MTTNRKPSAERPPEAHQADAQTREQDVLIKRVNRAEEAVHSLLTGIPPEVHQAVNRLLADPAPETSRMLEAWRTCARRDVETGRQIDVPRTARSTYTAFGIACLVAYSRTYVDELDAKRQALRRALPLTPPTVNLGG